MLKLYISARQILEALKEGTFDLEQSLIILCSPPDNPIAERVESYVQYAAHQKTDFHSILRSAEERGRLVVCRDSIWESGGVNSGPYMWFRDELECRNVELMFSYFLQTTVTISRRASVDFHILLDPHANQIAIVQD